MNEFRTELGDKLTRELVSGVQSLDDLIAKWSHHGYRPTLRGSYNATILANLYDQRAAELGLDVRAYRGG